MLVVTLVNFYNQEKFFEKRYMLPYCAKAKHGVVYSYAIQQNCLT